MIKSTNLMREGDTIKITREVATQAGRIEVGTSRAEFITADAWGIWTTSDEGNDRMTPWGRVLSVEVTR